MNEEVEPLRVLDAPRSDVHLVSTLEALQRAVSELKEGTGALAVDAERASGFKYSQRAYLVQVHRKGAGIYLIDPIAFSTEEFAILAEILNNETWILHAATQDLACLAELGLKPKQLFDTELISRLLGFERVGLGAVCELALGFALAKEHSAADWSTRPLPDSWLNYAALDVDVLPDMMDFLSKELQAQGKSDLAEQEMTNLLGFKPKPPKADRWRGMSGFHELKESRQLAVAKALWESRESLAQKLDVSPGRLVPDRSLIHAAKSLVKSRSALANDKSFNGRASRSYLDTWWAAIEFGLATRDLPPMRPTSTGMPNHRNWASKFPEADARLQTVKEVMTAISTSYKIPAENIMTPDYLRQLCFEPAGFTAEAISTQLLDLGARKWQVELVSAEIAQAWKNSQTKAS